MPETTYFFENDYSPVVSPKLENLPGSISNGISDIKKRYHPDFGFKELIEYKPKSGWAYLADLISKYPKRERMMNIIKYLNQHKEVTMGSMDRLLSEFEVSMSEIDKKRVIGEIYR
jgi:hypothetical protein